MAFEYHGILAFKAFSRCEANQNIGIALTWKLMEKTAVLLYVPPQKTWYRIFWDSDNLSISRQIFLIQHIFPYWKYTCHWDSVGRSSSLICHFCSEPIELLLLHWYIAVKKHIHSVKNIPFQIKRATDQKNEICWYPRCEDKSTPWPVCWVIWYIVSNISKRITKTCHLNIWVRQYEISYFFQKRLKIPKDCCRSKPPLHGQIFQNDMI